MTSNTPDELLHSIYINAKRNLIRNQPQDLMEADILCEDYCNKFASCITRDVLNTSNHDELRDKLLDDLFESTYLAQVLMAYIDAIDCNAEIAADELTNEILNEQNESIKQHSTDS